MQNLPKVNAIIMIVAFIVAIYLSSDLATRRVSEYKIETAGRAQMQYMPALGFDKFWADIAWMRGINMMGGVKGKMTKNMVGYFVKQFERITDLDPDFKLAYTKGVPFIAYQAPEKAIALMDKGEAMAKDSDWERPYLAAHWILQILVRNETDKAKKAEGMERAITYLQKAIDSNGPWYVENMLLHTRAKADGKYGKPLPELEAWHGHYMTRLGELTSTAGVEGEMGMAMAAPTMEMEDSNLERLRDRIVNRCRQLMVENLKSGNKENQEKIRAIYGDVVSVKHYSPYSLVPYAPGELFDRYTGQPLVPYGIDLLEYEASGKIHMLPEEGDYNPTTGKKAARTIEELKKMMGDKPITRLAAHVKK